MIDVWGMPVAASVEDIVKTVKTELILMKSPLMAEARVSGHNIMVNCISHGGGTEKKPSMGITTTETKGPGGKVYPAGTVHCFRCGYTADLPTFVSNCLGHNDAGMFGYKWIASRFVTVEIQSRPDIVVDMSRGPVKGEAIEIPEVTEEELESYRFTHPYMYERKLTDKVIEYFDVGYDQRTNALTFPVADKDGKVCFVQRRSVAGKSFMNENTIQKGLVVYGLYQVYKNLDWIDRLFICESIIDALTLWTYRMPAVALMGASPTVTQLTLLKKLPIRQLVLALDNDQVGREGSHKLKRFLGRTKMVYEAVLPKEVKDINKMAQDGLDVANVSVVLL